MSTIFELIIDEQIPGKFIWADDLCVAIVTIEPVQPGHTLVIPRQPIDKWSDLPPQLLDHLMRVAQIIAKAQEKAFAVPRSTVVIAGFEVPHAHIHVIPAQSEADCLLSNASASTDKELADVANSLRDVLREQGYPQRVPFELSSPKVS